ncbi:glycoside hydrolase family 3 C-terminal domain-containing protein [candidate division KSB1 bacterium]|nr:glycoside hydrolase family 3 C-terminal domain-containing protein [candidate division KSB1 bacterium]
MTNSKRNHCVDIFNLLIAFVLLLQMPFTVFSRDDSAQPIYLDPDQTFETRARDFLSRMTLEEKLSQMMSRTPTPLTRFGIPGYRWGGEPGHAVYARTGVTTIFPQAIAQAATWNEALIRRVASAISDESRARFHGGVPNTGLTFWSPVVELARDPRWGRTHECYGEDPYLTSRMSLAFVKGLQGDHPRYLKTIAAPKHYAANNEEWCRHTASSEIDEQLLREYYLLPYQVLVEEGKAESIMAAYNALNGVPCCCNKELLTDILRGEWGFDGSVVSDCNGIVDIFKNHRYVSTVQEAIAASINAGLDMECGDLFKVYLPEVVSSGLVTEETIDVAVGRLLLSRFRLGLYDPPERVPYTKIPMSVVDSPDHRQLARIAAREAIVLLKNENELLPLDKNNIKSIAVIGPNADVCQLGGYTGNYSKAVSPLEGIKNKIDSLKIRYEKGCDIKQQLPPVPTECLIPPGAKPGEHGLRGEYFNNTDLSGTPVMVRIDSTVNFDASRGAVHPQIHADTFSVRWTGKFVAPMTGPYYIGAVFDDAIRLYWEGKLLIDTWTNRNRSSAVKLLQLESGRHYDLRIEYCEHWYKAAMSLCGAPKDPQKFRKAAEIARAADAAIVVLGTDLSVENEGVDRSDLDLPGEQEELIKAIFAANARTIAVLQNGSALSINWLSEYIPAILVAWFAGEESGNAIADVLFGDFNPAGRLPLTFYKSVDQLPPFRDYDIRKGRTYMAEIRKGGSYRSQTDTPLYPFGHGLSYTRFSYSDLRISPQRIARDGTVTVSATVKNIGKGAGDEVVQLYISDVEAGVARPLKQLKGFKRITLKPNESRSVSFSLPARDLSFWDVNEKRFVIEPGAFEVLVGASSEDIRLHGTFNVE